MLMNFVGIYSNHKMKMNNIRSDSEMEELHQNIISDIANWITKKTLLNKMIGPSTVTY